MHGIADCKETGEGPGQSGPADDTDGQGGDAKFLFAIVSRVVAAERKINGGLCASGVGLAGLAASLLAEPAAGAPPCLCLVTWQAGGSQATTDKGQV